MQINMTADQEEQLTEKLLGLDFVDFKLQPGEDDITMLYVEEHFICGALHALSLSDEELSDLIKETIE